jgi:DnaJ like chaperone protein
LANLADVVTQTFRSFTPDALSDRFFRDPLNTWWLEYNQLLTQSGYTGSAVQMAFFIAGFTTMGALAKCDGRINEAEIQLATQVMDHLNLNTEQKRIAIKLFNDGKQPDFPLDAVLNRFARASRYRVSVLQIFLEIQLQLAYADGRPTVAELAFMKRLSKRLDISDSIFARIERRVCVERTGELPQSPMSYSDACNLLGVNRFSRHEEVKQAWRRLLSQHHPDKVIAAGGDEKAIAVAKGMMQDVQRAYELICKTRKFR